MALSAVQALNAVASFLRIPLLTATLGDRGYGALVAISSVVPWILVVAAGLRTSTRTLVAEYIADGRPEQARRTVHRATRRGSVLVGVVVLCGGVGLLLPVKTFLGPGTAYSPEEFRLAFLVTVLLSASALPGGAWMGSWEGRGHAAVANGLLSASAVLGLPLTCLACALSDSIVVFAAITTAASACPFWFMPLVGRWVGSVRHGRQDTVSCGDGGSTSSDGSGASCACAAADQALSQSLRAAIGLSAATLLGNGLDPVIVAMATDASDAAVYGLATRLAAFVLVLPTSTAPVLGTWFASRRASRIGREDPAPSACRSRLGGARRHVVGVMLAYAAVAGPACTLYVAVGPRIGEMLGLGAIACPPDVYLAMGLSALALSVLAPLTAALSGPRAIRLLARQTLCTSMLNVFGSMVLVRQCGPAGPAWASVIAVALALAFWGVVLARDESLLTETYIALPDPPAHTISACATPSAEEAR